MRKCSRGIENEPTQRKNKLKYEMKQKHAKSVLIIVTCNHIMNPIQIARYGLAAKQSILSEPANTQASNAS